MTVVITPELENPFVITMRWNDEVLVPDTDTGDLPIQSLTKEGAEVEATVKDENGDIVIPGRYEWYLQDELLSCQDKTINIPGTLEPGFYQLILIVKKESILSSECIKFSVE